VKRTKDNNGELTRSLAARGFRATAQREQVYRVLLQHRDHPTAEQVFLRVKRRLPDISMATVYNCLDTLVQAGLVRQVQVDRAATRYCPNMTPHGHFHCVECGQVFDIPCGLQDAQAPFRLPRGFKVQSCEVSIQGRCPACADKARSQRSTPA